MHQENRRSFVKKSLATSMTFTFSGLIRAHGEEGGETTTSSPDETTIPETTIETSDSGGTTTWNPEETTVATTIPEETTTWNPDNTTVVTTAVATTEARKFEVWGEPQGDPESTDGYSQIVKQFASSGYFLKLKMWCDPDHKSFTKVSLKSTCECYGNGKIFTKTEKLEFSGDKVTAEAYEFPDGQPKLENSVLSLVDSWTTGNQNQGNLEKHEIELTLEGSREDPVPQSWPPVFIVKLTLKGTLKQYSPGNTTWTLIDTIKEEITENLELTILSEIV